MNSTQMVAVGGGGQDNTTNVPLNRLGHRQMVHKAHVGLVNAHAERNCRTDDLRRAILPSALNSCAVFVGHTSVVRLRADAEVAVQLFGCLFTFVPRETVDDSCVQSRVLKYVRTHASGCKQESMRGTSCV